MIQPNSITSEADRLYEAIRRVGLNLHLPIDRTEIDFEEKLLNSEAADYGEHLTTAGRYVGIFFKEVLLHFEDVLEALIEGFPVVLLTADRKIHICEALHNSRIEVCTIDDQVHVRLMKKHELRNLMKSSDSVRTLLCKPELECRELSAASSGHEHSEGHHSSMKPLKRFINMLRMDQRDVWTVVLFALVAGILSLATPLAVDALVSVVSWGTFMQPLVVLSLMLLVCLTLASFLEILQTVLIELIQRRYMVRLVSDFSHRFPRANRDSLHGAHPRELANRVFDVMTIQKAAAVLLMDGLSIVLTTIIGLVLLAFYHPFLMGFAIVLVISMISITWVLGRGGVRTAIDESIVKYRIAHWVQDILAAPSAFKINGGENLAIERANRLLTEYLEMRSYQFRVLIRQIAFAIGLQVIASTALLGLGGYLVITQQLTLGQLVASELVVAVVVGAFAKLGKSLEKYYDLMAGTDKVGHLLDIEVDDRSETPHPTGAPVGVRWNELEFHEHQRNAHFHIHPASVNPGSRVALTGTDSMGLKLLMDCLGGLIDPSQGMVEIGGMSVSQASRCGGGRIVGFATHEELFCGTILENIDLGRTDVTRNRVRDVLHSVGLWDTVLRLPKGMRTMLQTGGAPLSKCEQAQLFICRAIAGKPELLLIDGLLDEMPTELRSKVWDMLKSNPSWTIIIATNSSELIEQCDQIIELTPSHDTHAEHDHE